MLKLRTLIIFLILLAHFGYSQKPGIYKKVYYFYDSENVLKKHPSNWGIIYGTSKPIRYRGLGVWSEGLALYNLIYKQGDFVYTKPKSYLKTIHYFDSQWLKSEANLKNFWSPDNSMKIYLIEEIPNTDYLIFRRVDARLILPE
jgi:hypothetical protein